MQVGQKILYSAYDGLQEDNSKAKLKSFDLEKKEWVANVPFAHRVFDTSNFYFNPKKAGGGSVWTSCGFSKNAYFWNKKGEGGWSNWPPPKN